MVFLEKVRQLLSRSSVCNLNLVAASNQSSMHEVNTDRSSSAGLQAENAPTSVQRVMTVLQSLKAQHAALLKTLQSHPFPDLGQPMQGSLPATAEVEERFEQPDLRRRLVTPISRRSGGTSIATTDSGNEWFDALDGAEEFVMDIQAAQEGTEPSSQIYTDDTRSVISRQDDSSIDTDLGDDNDNPHTPPTLPDDKQIATGTSQATVMRRTELPTSPTGDEGSLFTMLKKNVGKVCATLTAVVA